MKVSLQAECGMVLPEISGNEFGLILWGTQKEKDIEAWCGLYARSYNAVEKS
jgi:hypothetical protein